MQYDYYSISTFNHIQFFEVKHMILVLINSILCFVNRRILYS